MKMTVKIITLLQKKIIKNRYVAFCNSCLPLETQSKALGDLVRHFLFTVWLHCNSAAAVLMPELRLCCLQGHSAPTRAGSCPCSFSPCQKVFFPLQPRTRAELQYVAISKCQDCIMLTMCCDASLITLGSSTRKVEVSVSWIWYVLYSCLPQGLHI